MTYPVHLLNSRVERNIPRVVVELSGTRVDLEGLLFSLKVPLELMSRRATPRQVRVDPIQLLTQFLLPGPNRFNLTEESLLGSVVDEIDACRKKVYY